MKIGDKVRLSDKGRERYWDSFVNPHNLQGVLVEPLDKVYPGFIYKVEWSNGEINSYKEGELKLTTAKPKFYDEVITKKVKLNRDYVTTELPSGGKFVTSGGSGCVAIVGGSWIKNDDIPTVITHLQQWYDAVQLEKGDNK